MVDPRALFTRQTFTSWATLMSLVVNFFILLSVIYSDRMVLASFTLKRTDWEFFLYFKCWQCPLCLAICPVLSKSKELTENLYCLTSLWWKACWHLVQWHFLCSGPHIIIGHLGVMGCQLLTQALAQQNAGFIQLLFLKSPWDKIRYWISSIMFPRMLLPTQEQQSQGLPELRVPSMTHCLV